MMKGYKVGGVALDDCLNSPFCPVVLSIGKQDRCGQEVVRGRILRSKSKKMKQLK